MSTSKYILYADDDEDDLDFVRNAFDQHVRDVQLILCNGGEEVLRFLEQCGKADYPCLIILDMNMPRMGGKEVLRRIRQKGQYEDIPVVFFTTSSDHSDMHFARTYGAGFVTKPIDMKQMRQIIDKFLDHCSSGVVFDRINSQSSGI